MGNISQLLKSNKIDFEEKEYNVQLIHYSKLHRSPYQFYVERDIEQFADELEVAGQIVQPLVVREINIGSYEIIAGHRRDLAAIYNVETKGLEKFKKLPCYIIDVDDIMAEYLVIKTNASREKTAWEIMHEIERLKYLIPRLPVNKNMKGRLQNYVVLETGLTKSVVGRYEHVANELTDKGKEQLREGKLNISVANKLASLDSETQDKILETIHELTIIKIDQFLEERELSLNAVKEILGEDNNVPAMPVKEIRKPDPEIKKSFEECGTYIGTGTCSGCYYQNTDCSYDRTGYKVAEWRIENDKQTEIQHELSRGKAEDQEERSALWFVTNFCETSRHLSGLIEAYQKHSTNADRAKAFQEILSPGGAAGGTMSDGIFYDFYRYDKGIRFQFVSQKLNMSYIQFVKEFADMYGPFPDQDEKVAPVAPAQQEEIVQEKPELDEEYTPEQLLQEKRKELDEYLAVDGLPDRLLARQKIIVESLTLLVETRSEIPKVEQPELTKLKNNDQRKEWLQNYKDWGIWYKDENIGATYYKYDFEDGTRLIAEEYPSQYHDYTSHLHLVGGSPERPKDQYGSSKYPYHELYTKYPDSESEVVEFLKHIQKGKASK